MQLKKITKSPEPQHRRWYEDACGTAHALELVGERWALLVVRELMFGPKRFSDLRADLPGISANILTQRLEGLERAGIVMKTKLPPPASAQVYELTAWGYESEPILQTLGRWAARSPEHDPSLPLSAVSLMMSLRTMIDPLRAKGIDATTKTNIGAREIYLRALEDNSVQVFPEYTGALAVYYDKEYAGTDAEEVYAKAQEVVPDTLTVLEKSAAEDVDSLAVTKETADSKGLKTIEDLKAVAGDLTLAAQPEFKERPQGVVGLEKVYGVTFGSFRPLTGQAVMQALVNGQADVANVFSTDPGIAANNLVVLEDTKRVFGSQNIVPLVRADKADQVKDALNAVSAKLTTDAVTQMLKQTDIDKKDPKAVAEEFLKANGLG